MWVVLGPTASGKTRFAVQLAQKYQGEIISADSRQVYQGMDIGTGKDLAEYGTVSHYLIDQVPAGEKYDVYQFKRDALSAYAAIVDRGSQPILCGGSGMFLDALIRDYDLRPVERNAEIRAQFANKHIQLIVEEIKKYKKVHNSSDSIDRERALRSLEIAIYQKNNPYISSMDCQFNVIGISCPREVLKQRIKARLKKRFEEGMIDEVRELLDQGVSYETLVYYGLEYKFIALHLKGELNYNDCFQKLNAAIAQFAKRQMTWFRRMEKKGVNIHWVDGELTFDQKLRAVQEVLL